jgi:hypothetical protein
MSEHNEQITRLLAADAPDSRDFSFELAVMARLEQRRFRRGLVMNLALAAAAATLLALAMPELERTWQQSFAGALSNGMIAAGLCAATLALQWGMARRI